MMIGVSLQLEQQVVGEAMRSIPAMKNRDLLVLSIGQQLPRKTIVLDVVDSLKVKDCKEGYKRVYHQGFQPEDQIRYNRIDYTCQYAQNRIIREKALSQFLLILVNSLPGVHNAPSDELIHIFSLLGGRRILGRCHLMMMSIQMVICEMHVVEIEHMQSRQYSVKLAGFMHDFMGYCELGRKETARDVDHSDEERQVAD